MKVVDANKVLDAKDMIRRWDQEIEDKVNDYPRKISQKRYVEEKTRLSLIQYVIFLFETELKNSLNIEEVKDNG